MYYEATAVWGSTAWVLAGCDTVLPFGDIVYAVGVAGCAIYDTWVLVGDKIPGIIEWTKQTGNNLKEYYSSDKIESTIVNVTSGNTVGNLWKDKLANPQDWELTKENRFPGKRKGTTSYEREYSNKKTGEKIYDHEIKNDATGKTIHGPHPRGYEKGESGDKSSTTEGK